jgi:hypothetical protein
LSGAGEDKVGGVRQGEEGDVSVGILDGLGRGSGILLIDGVEFGPRCIGGGERGHLRETVSSNIRRLF